MEGRGRGLIVVHPGICFVRLRKTVKAGYVPASHLLDTNVDYYRCSSYFGVLLLIERVWMFMSVWTQPDQRCVWCEQLGSNSVCLRAT